MPTQPDPIKPADLALRRDQVARLTAEGHTPLQIVEKLNISILTLTRDLNYVAKLWRRQLKRDPATAKAYELAKINRLEAAAWEAWERSCRDEKSTKVIVEDGKQRAEGLSKNQSGNPKFLDRIAWCIERRLRILVPPDPRDALGENDDAENIPIEQRRKRVAALLDVFRKRERVEAARQRTVDAPAGHPPEADPPAPVG